MWQSFFIILFKEEETHFSLVKKIDIFEKKKKENALNLEECEGFGMK